MAWDFTNWPWNKKQEPVPSAVVPPLPDNSLVEKMSIIGNLDNNFSGKMNSRFDAKDYQAAAAFSSVYTKVATYRKDVITEVDKLREFYLTDVIISQFTDDALAPDVVSNEILTVYSEKPEINKELQRLQEKVINFDELVTNITPDIIAYGEYTLATTIKEKQGIVDLHDTVDQGLVIPLEKNGEIQGYLVMEKRGMSIKPPSDYIKFSLSSKRIRIDLHKELGSLNLPKEQLNQIPRFIRIGKSFLYPIRAKIKELELLEQLVPATKLSKLAQGTVVGVSVPAGFDVEKGMEVGKRMEGLLNKKIGVDTDKGQLTLENIMTAAGRLKVIPIFGDKGSLQKFDYKQDEPDDLLNSVNDVRKTITDSVGIPYELIFVSDSVSKGEILRRYARYVRKLKSIQKAISDGIRQVCYIHLSNKGISFVEDDIKVDFKNKLVEIDNLNKLEFLDTTIAMLKNVRDFVYELKSENSFVKDDVRISVLKDFLNEQLSLVGLRGLIQESGQEQRDIKYGIYQPPEQTEPGQGGDDNPTGSADQGPSPQNKLANPSGSSGPSGGGGGGTSGSAPVATTPTPTPNVGGTEPEVIDIEDLGNQ